MTSYGTSIPVMVRQEPQDEPRQDINDDDGEIKDEEEGKVEEKEGDDGVGILCIDTNAPKDVIVAIDEDREDFEFDDIVPLDREKRHVENDDEDNSEDIEGDLLLENEEEYYLLAEEETPKESEEDFDDELESWVMAIDAAATLSIPHRPINLECETETSRNGGPPTRRNKTYALLCIKNEWDLVFIDRPEESAGVDMYRFKIISTCCWGVACFSDDLHGKVLALPGNETIDRWVCLVEHKKHH